MAFRLLQPLAEKGDHVAEWQLAEMYAKGQGVKQDYAEAVKWWKKMAEQGYGYAQDQLGAVYHDGIGVKQDFAESYFWYSISDRAGMALCNTDPGCGGGPYFPNDSTSAAKLLTPEQKALADERVIAWEKKHYPPDSFVLYYWSPAGAKLRQ